MREIVKIKANWTAKKINLKKKEKLKNNGFGFSQFLQ